MCKKSSYGCFKYVRIGFINAKQINEKRSELKIYLGELKDYGTNIKEIQKRPEVIAEARWKLFEYMNQRMGNSLNQTISKFNKPNKLNDFKFFHGTK